MFPKVAGKFETKEKSSANLEITRAKMSVAGISSKVPSEKDHQKAF
jgi:hypothetical protein